MGKTTFFRKPPTFLPAALEAIVQSIKDSYENFGHAVLIDTDLGEKKRTQLRLDCAVNWPNDHGIAAAEMLKREFLLALLPAAHGYKLSKSLVATRILTEAEAREYQIKQPAYLVNLALCVPDEFYDLTIAMFHTNARIARRIGKRAWEFEIREWNSEEKPVKDPLEIDDTKPYAVKT